MPDAFWTHAFLCVSAFLAGALNSVAGGGTLLTFPALTGVVEAAIANATSTFALLPGSLAGAFGYRKEVAECRRFILRMLLPSLAGGLLGTWLVVQNAKAFATLVPWLILTAAVLFLLQQPVAKWMKAHKPDHEPGRTAVGALLFAQFLIAVYGGYFGAGIGILMLTALGFMGIPDIHRMNAVKTILATVINGASVVVFTAQGMVRWEYAGPMVVASVAGGYIGARVARRLPAAAVRWAVIVIGFGLSAWYFYLQYAAPRPG